MAAADEGGPSRRELVRLSKLLSRALRHRPDVLDLELDEHGWAEVDAVLAGAARRGRPLTREVLERLVEGTDKKRFERSEDGARIRAAHGHTIPVDLDLPAATPPEVLYHGTVATALAGIRAHGLLPGARLYVHLSEDEETARRVGARRGAPIVLRVRAGVMARAGHRFRRSKSGVWLVERVPAEFVVFD